jgi:pimeloyl-ACP methyl ester carboxylesterase
MRLFEDATPRRGHVFTVEGRRVHVLIDGGPRVAAGANQPPPPSIVLLHGCGSLAEEIAQAFAASGVATIAPDRPGYGLSEPLSPGEHGPLGQSRWLEQVLAALSLGNVVLVAHSLAAGPALLLGERRPDLVKGILLIAPFCRPTPHRAMPLLRLAVLPVLGTLVRRHVIQPLAVPLGRRCLRESFRPDSVPRRLAIPFAHAAGGTAVVTMAGELRAFNDDMLRFRTLGGKMPLRVLHGDRDQTADPAWHLPWLRARAEGFSVEMVRNSGHMAHHAHAEKARGHLRGLLNDIANRTARGERAPRPSRTAAEGEGLYV